MFRKTQGSRTSCEQMRVRLRETDVNPSFFRKTTFRQPPGLQTQRKLLAGIILEECIFNPTSMVVSSKTVGLTVDENEIY